jgi:starch synthase
MPSRFEPCGLTQMYSLAYGTLPVVHATGGLLDTVVDASESALAAGTATGFQYGPVEALAPAVARARALYREAPDRWSALMANAMAQRFDWDTSARAYLEVYQAALADAARASVERSR